MLTEKLAHGISNKVVRWFALKGANIFGEGMEELLTEEMSTIGRWLTYQTDQDLFDMLFSEEAMDAKLDAFLGGAILGGLGPVDADAMRYTNTPVISEDVDAGRISMEEFANTESSLWRNVAYEDTDTKNRIMLDTHNAMVSEGAVVKVSDEIAADVDSAFPDLRGMKKQERTPILKAAMSKLKSDLRQFLNGFKDQKIEFEVNGKILDAKLYNTGINEVLDKVTKQKAEMLYSSGEIFQNARYLYSTQDYDGDPNVYRWNYFYTPVQIGEDTVGVRIAVRDLVKQSESQIYNWGIKKDASLDGVRDDKGRKPYGVSSDAFNNSISETTPGVNGENVSELTKLARETVDARYEAENGAGLDGISAEGRAIYEDQAVDVVDIDTAGGGKVTVKLADGRSVDATALEYEDSGEAELWRVIGQYAEDADSARALLQEYRNGDLDAYKYARGIEEAFLFGKLNLSPKEMDIKSSLASLLNPRQRKEAYNQGRIAGEMKKQQTERQQERVDTVYKQARTALGQKGTDVSEHSVQLADGLTVEKMGRSQRASYELAQKIAPAVKGDVRIYNGGKEWGYYDHKTDTICLNVNAKWSGVSMMAFTLGHELVHRAKLGSPAKYQAFVDFLVEQYGEQGASVNDMVQEQLQAAEEAGLKMTFKEAFEEVVADACQKMLVDTDAGKRLAEFGAKSEQNKSIVKQVGQWLKDLIQKLRRIFRNVEPDSLAAQEFQKFDDNVKQILTDMFVDMSMDAGEKLSTIKAAGLTEKITTDKGGVSYKYSVKGNLNADITAKDVAVLQSIGRISINQFTSQDLAKTQKWAQRFWKDLNVKSPFFRAWFGDWRSLSTAPAEIVQFAYGEAGKLNYNKRTVKCKDMNGKQILVDDTVIEDSLHYAKKNGDEKQIRKLLGKVDEILEKGILLDTQVSAKKTGNKKGSTQFMHYLYTPISINGAPFVAKLSVEEYDLTGKNRAYNLQRIELSTLSRAQFAEMITQNRGKYAYSADALTVAQLHEFVKQKDASFQPKDASSVVNANGTPKRVFHGSVEMFNTFSYGHIGSASGVSFLGDGFYFTDKKSLANNYGVNVYETYLQMRKPYYATEADAYKLNSQELEKKGYDGVILDAPSGKIYMVFQNTQIKSATDNIGTFDGNNPDIRYKMPVGKDAADRTMLADLFEQMVTGSDEYRALQNYKKNIDQMLALEEKVDRLSEEIKRVSSSEGPKNMEYLDNLKRQRKQAVAELNKFDNILLGLEKSGVLRAMIERNRQVVRQESYKKAREYYREKNETREAEIRQYYRESRRKAVERHEQAEVRQRIRKDVQRLDSLLNKGTKEKNVKLELKEFAGAALRTAKGTFLKNYNEYEMVRSGVNATMSWEQKVQNPRHQSGAGGSFVIRPLPGRR